METLANVTVYVLTQVDEKVLHAFIPFWDITGIQIPIDYETEKHRGFAFIEFELAEVSLINLYANITIRVNIAKPMRIKEGSSRPVWSDDDWLKKFSGTTAEEAEVTESTGESKGRTNPQRTSSACAHMRRALASKAAVSTMSSHSSCVREETSPTTMALGVSLSTGESLRMRTLSSNTLLQVRHVPVQL
uniref:Peptidylprolyl isomerase E (cyclophilin E) n=1 Tax=Oncorhynchus mykiss TaxID=8022 RepID=A0A8C7SYD2_ONCMY